MKATLEHKLSEETEQLEIYRTKLINCTSPSAFDWLQNRFFGQEIIVKEVQDKINQLLLNKE